MPYKDPEKQRAYQRDWQRKRRQDPDYLDRQKETRRRYIEANPWINLGRGRQKGIPIVPISICRAVYLRAQGECEMKDSRPCKGPLTLHHVDGDIENHEESNLKLACDFHHKSHEAKKRYPKGTIWGRNIPRDPGAISGLTE